MPILDAETYKTLAAAVKTPNNFLTGAERKKLNVAFDLAASKIFTHVFGSEPGNRMQLRRKLNNTEKAAIPKEHHALVEALKAALKSATPLQSKGYPGDGDEEDKEILSFIDSKLAALVKQLGAR